MSLLERGMVNQGTVKFRIVEETSVFSNGARELAFRLEVQDTENPEKWHDLGTSPTLGAARKALLFHAPVAGVWLG